MRKLVTGLLPLLLFPACIITVPAQDRGVPIEERPAVGIMGGVLLNRHGADFSKFPGIPSCCTGYDGGDGTGLGFGIVYETRIDERWSLDLLLRYADYSATLSTEEYIGPVLTPRGPEAAAVEHRIESATQAVDFRPTLGFRPFTGLGFALFAGTHLGYLMTNDMHQTEELLRPADVSFADLQRVRNDVEGAVPGGSSLYAAFATGVRWPFMIGGNVALRPEFAVRLAATQLSGDVNWSAHGIEGGLAVLYHIPEPPPLLLLRHHHRHPPLMRVCACWRARPTAVCAMMRA